MKYFYILILPLLLTSGVHAQSASDTTHYFTAVERNAEFPGGINAFINYISQNLKYPEVARLIGINGKLFLTCVVDTTGNIIDVRTKNCIGAGCEAEAEAVLYNSPKWAPGIQNSRPVRIQYNIPINFNIPKGKVAFKELRKSDYGFIFFIKGKTCSIDEAETLLGRSFESANIEIAEAYSDEEHYPMPGKKETYLIKMKG
jgi:protein TonB